MSKTTTELCSIVNKGGSIILDASTKTTLDLCSIARTLHGDATLTLKNAATKTTVDLCSIANINPGKVIFDFS